MGTSNKQYLTTVYNTLTTSLDMQVEALPKGFNKARFAQNCLSVMQDGKADFSNCEATTVVRTLLKGATLGLDFFNGECYAIPYGGKCEFQTDYKGEKKLVKKYSIRPIKDIYAKLVRQGDTFTEKIENGQQSIDFLPLPFNDSDIIGAFAVVLYTDGGMDYEAMSKNDIESVKKNFSKNGKAWDTSYGEMCKKTVLRRLCKHIEVDFETVEMQKLWQTESDFDVNKKPERQEVPTVFEEDTDAIDVEYEEIERMKATEELPFK